jgi:hypothetical protein
MNWTFFREREKERVGIGYVFGLLEIYIPLIMQKEYTADQSWPIGVKNVVAFIAS